jgi:glycosyltransferase involved in cell wall biosynthesis
MIKKLNVWYCHPYACAPSTGKKNPNRSYFLAKELNQLNCKVTVVTSSFEHLSGEKQQVKRGFKLKICDDVDFAWIKTPHYKSNGMMRVVNMLLYAYGLKRQYRLMAASTGTPDVIICSAQHPFHFKACRKIANEYGALLISEIRDLWPLSLIELLGVSKFHPLCLWLERIQSAMCLHSDVLVSLLEYAKPYLRKNGLDDSKFIHIPNGYSESHSDETAPISEDKDYQWLKQMASQGKFIIGYTGAHGAPNHLNVLCQAMQSINDERFQLVMIGDGAIKHLLKEKYVNCSNIHFIDAKPKAQIKAYQQLFHLGYMGVKNHGIYRYGISLNKMYEYMYNKVIALVGSYPGNTAIDKANCAISYDNDCPESLKNAILSAAKKSEKDIKAMKMKGYSKVTEQYTYRKLAQDYYHLFVKLKPAG